MSQRSEDIAKMLGESSPESDMTPADAAKELIRREKCRNDLIEFCRFIDPRYEAFEVHQLIARKLEDVEAGRSRRLAIFVPPAIGKSRLASELFPAWFFGRNPYSELIETSYDADLAFGFGRNVRNLVKDPRYNLIFPETKIAADSSSMDEWHTSLGGEYKAEGVGGGLIGFHGNIAIIDDPFKGYVTASSVKQQEMVWDWYSGTLLNRLRSYNDGPGAVILIMQRWHDMDLGGRIEKLHEGGEETWEIIQLPSIAEADDPLGRKSGEALLPDGPNRRTIDELRQIQKRQPAMFMAVHQQKPVSDDGDIFNPDWFRQEQLQNWPKRLTYYLSSDFALTKGKGDYTVHILFGVCENGHVWLEQLYREQVDVLEGVEKACEMMLQYSTLKHFIERVQMTKAIGSFLQKRKAELNAWTTLESVSVMGKGSKDSDDRAGSIAGAMQMGYVHVPSGARWLGDLSYELSRFPNGRYDDQADALSLIGMNLHKLRGRTADIEERKPFVLDPVGFTFDQLVDRNKRFRKGLRVKREAVLLPLPPPSVLDET